MLLDLSRLRTGVERVEREFDPAAIAPSDDDFRVTAPVAFVAEARKDGRKIRLVGRLATTIECACSRCLEPFATPVEAAFDLLYLPREAEAAPPDAEIAGDDLGVSFYENDTIDLGQIVAEQLYLALPMKPLCRPDCRGLCPHCGTNLNRGTCDCDRKWEDPRLAALKSLHLKNPEPGPRS
jgi:uncharacterized protein